MTGYSRLQFGPAWPRLGGCDARNRVLARDLTAAVLKATGCVVLRGTLLHVTVDHLPDGREPLKAMWLWHVGPAPFVHGRAMARRPRQTKKAPSAPSPRYPVLKKADTTGKPDTQNRRSNVKT